MGDIRVGTASWTDKSLIESGLFYPPNVTTAEERLRYYSKQFPCVEVDSSYYSLPTPRNSALWAERSPDGFLFDVKAFRLFTRHQTPLDALPKDIRKAIGQLPEGNKRNVYYTDLPSELRGEMWRRFLSALAPLEQTARLGAVLLQFPPWFHPSQQNIEHILHCADMLADRPIAIEFRQAGWLSERNWRQTVALLRENGLALVVVDEPQGFKSSVPFLPVVTSPDLALVRLHGRNAEMWDAKGLASSSERFNYLYSEEELRGFVDPLKALMAEAAQVRVYFNNNYRNYAQANAAQLRLLLSTS